MDANYQVAFIGFDDDADPTFSCHGETYVVSWPHEPSYGAPPAIMYWDADDECYQYPDEDELPDDVAKHMVDLARTIKLAYNGGSNG
jgi:hypothetical protein